MKKRIIKIICFLIAAVCTGGAFSCAPRVDAGTQIESGAGAGTSGESGVTNVGATPDPDKNGIGLFMREPREYNGGGANACMWGNTLFSMGVSQSDRGFVYEPMYVDLSDNEDTKLRPVYSDPLADPYENPFAFLNGHYAEWRWMFVDEEATVKNGGAPVLILIGSYNANIQEDGPSIKKTIISSFDTLTNKAAVIKDNIDGALRSAFMHRGTIYYALNHSDGADMHALYKIEGDGSGYEEIDIDGKDYLSVYTIRDGTVYYYSDDPEDDCVYTCDLDFKNHKKLFEGGYLRDVTDEYIYYIANIDAEKKTCELCRRALDDISKEEVILPEIPSSGCSVNDGKAYIFGEGYASLTEYDLESGKSRIIFEGEKECDAAPKRVDIDNGRMILEKFAEWYIVIELEKGEVRYIPASK